MGQYTPTYHPELLAEHAVAYRQSRFIADEACPVSGTDSKLVKYYKYTRADANRITDDEMSPDGMPNQRKFSKTSVEVEVAPHGLFDRLPITDLTGSNDGGDLEMDTVEDLTDDILLNREKRVADLLMTPANYGSANKVTLSTPWTNQTSSTPIQTIQTGQRACALPPNIMVMDRVTWDAFRIHPDILDRLGGPTRKAGMAQRDQVAEMFELEKVLIGEVRYNSANPGATEAYSYIWPQGRVLLAHQPQTPRKKQLMLARTYRLNQTNNGGADAEGARPGERRGGFLVTQVVEEQRGTAGTLFIKVAHEEKSVHVATDAGYLISSAA